MSFFRLTAATVLLTGIIPQFFFIQACSGQETNSIFVRESFDDCSMETRGWYDGTECRIAADAFSGNGCLEYEWLKGLQKVTGSASFRHLFTPVSEVYVSFYIRLSENWQWTGKNYHPHLTHLMTTENPPFHGPAASHLTLYIEAVNGKLRLATQDIQNKDMPHGLTQGELKGGYNGRFYDSRQVLFADNKWHRVEAFFRLNDLKNDRPEANGIIRGWFDGKLVIDETGVVLRSADFPQMQFNQFLIAPYFGPGLLDNHQKLWFDELIIGPERAERL